MSSFGKLLSGSIPQFSKILNTVGSYGKKILNSPITEQIKNTAASLLDLYSDSDLPLSKTAGKVSNILQKTNLKDLSNKLEQLTKTGSSFLEKGEKFIKPLTVI